MLEVATCAIMMQGMGFQAALMGCLAKLCVVYSLDSTVGCIRDTTVLIVLGGSHGRASEVLDQWLFTRRTLFLLVVLRGLALPALSSPQGFQPQERGKGKLV